MERELIRGYSAWQAGFEREHRKVHFVNGEFKGIWQGILGANSRIVEKEFQDTYFLPLWAHNFSSGAQQTKSGPSRLF